VDLSAREERVLALGAQGDSNEKIAATLFLIVRTVERHLANSYVKPRVSGNRHARRLRRATYKPPKGLQARA
jgi:DNA-binding CsgD family transcriptional regulator